MGRGREKFSKKNEKILWSILGSGNDGHGSLSTIMGVAMFGGGVYVIYAENFENFEDEE